MGFRWFWWTIFCSDWTTSLFLVRVPCWAILVFQFLGWSKRRASSRCKRFWRMFFGRRWDQDGLGICWIGIYLFWWKLIPNFMTNARGRWFHRFKVLRFSSCSLSLRGWQGWLVSFYLGRLSQNFWRCVDDPEYLSEGQNLWGSSMCSRLGRRSLSWRAPSSRWSLSHHWWRSQFLVCSRAGRFGCLFRRGQPWSRSLGLWGCALWLISSLPLLLFCNWVWVVFRFGFSEVLKN